jgi:transcriptional regulator with XRE-family HTH domain
MDDLAATIDLLEHLGERVKAHRYRLNVTRREVAEVTGLSMRTILDLEGDTRNISPRATTVLALLRWMEASATDGRRPGASVEERSERGARAWEERRHGS